MRLIEARDPETSSAGVPTVLLFSLPSAHSNHMSSACTATAFMYFELQETVSHMTYSHDQSYTPLDTV